MADEIDPRFEAWLRTAFRGAVEGTPLGVREDEVFERWRSRRIRRLAIPASLLAAAGVVMLALVAGLPRLIVDDGVAALSSGSADSALATYADLTALLPGDAVAPTVRGEHLGAGASPGGAPIDLGAVGAGSPVWYALSCAADTITLTFDTGDTTPDTMSLACGATPVSGSLDWVAGPANVTVSAPSNLPWRLVLAAGSGAARQVEPFDELHLVAQRARATGGVTIASGEGPGAGATDGLITSDLGTVGAVRDIQLVLDCIGGSIEVRVVAGDTVLAGYKGACEPAVDVENIVVDARDPEARLIVVAANDVAWRLLAVGPVPAATAAP